jgi:hypothetical protein
MDGCRTACNNNQNAYPGAPIIFSTYGGPTSRAGCRSRPPGRWAASRPNCTVTNGTVGLTGTFALQATCTSTAGVASVTWRTPALGRQGLR